MLYVAPETLTKQENLDIFSDLKISFLLLTKLIAFLSGGMISDLNIRRLREMMIQINPDIPVIALTATATPKCKAISLRTSICVILKIYTASFNRSNLYYEIQPKIKKESRR